MSIRTVKSIVAGVCVLFPLTAGAQYSSTETTPFKITEKSRWQLEGTYNRIQIERAESGRIICLASDGDMIMFDHKGKVIEDNKDKRHIKLKRETLDSHFVVYNTTDTIMRISPSRYPVLSPSGQTLVVFPRAFIPKREYDWKISLYGNDSSLLWESASPDFEEPLKSSDALIPQINSLPQFSPNGEFFVIGVQNQLYMYSRKGLVWKYKDPDPEVKFNQSSAIISDDGKKTIINLTKTHYSPAYLFNGEGKVLWERGFPGSLSVWLDERYLLLAVDSGKLLLYDTQTYTLDIPVLLKEREHYGIKGVDYIQATGELALLIEKARSERGNSAYEKYINPAGSIESRLKDGSYLELLKEIEHKTLEVRLYEIRQKDR